LLFVIVIVVIAVASPRLTSAIAQAQGEQPKALSFIIYLSGDTAVLIPLE
jgi:hypothetical protein